MFFFPAFPFLSCQQKAAEKKESWAIVIDFFSPDTVYYPGMKNFPFPDSLKFASLVSIFTNQNKPPVISDSSIVFYDTYRENGQKLCCIPDTLEIFIDSIKGRKYMFVIGEYITVFQSNNNVDTNIRTRKNHSPPRFWNIQLNTPYPAEKFKDEHEKLGTKYVKIRESLNEVYKQKWNENDSILVETIQFNNSNDRIVTAVYKEINEAQVDSTIDYLKNKFPSIKYEEAVQRDDDGKPIKVIRMRSAGVYITFTQTTPKEYAFVINDYYETMKLVLYNAENGYTFRDDVKVY